MPRKGINPNSYLVKLHLVCYSLKAGKFYVHLFINKLHKKDLLDVKGDV